MAKVKTFVLRKAKTFRRGVRVFIKGKDGKFAARTLVFTKEHLIDKNHRYLDKAKKIHATYSTLDEIEIAALFADPSYGEDFYLKGDEKGEMKQASYIVSDENKELVAITNLMEAAGLKVDDKKDISVLKEEYRLHLEGAAGVRLNSIAGAPAQIPITPINVQQNLLDQVAAARKVYQERFGEPVPEIVTDDLTFLDGVMTEGFDIKKYIEDKVTAKGQKGGNQKYTEAQKAELWEEYKALKGNNPPASHKNNVEWLKLKIQEAQNATKDTGDTKGE